MSGAGPPSGDRRQPDVPGGGRFQRAALRPSRLQLLVAVVLLLGLVQILYEEAVLFLATTTGGLPGPLSSRLVAIGVPLAIAALLVGLLVGGALLAEGRDGRAARAERPARDPEDLAADREDPPDGDCEAESREE